MSRPLISVLTTLYNHERFIHQTITSALGQTAPPDEIIIIDDASTDNSVSVAASISHPSIQLFREPNNLGGANTMKGLNACKGDFVAILNSDDYWQPEKLQQQVEYMLANPQCGVVFTRVKLVDENSVPWQENSHSLQKNFSVPNRSRESWLNHFFSKGNPFCASSALIRKECLTQLGPLDGRYIQLQDLDMWTRIAIHGYQLHVIDNELTNYRVSRKRSNMSSQTLKNHAIFTYEYARLLRNFWQLSSLAELTRIFPEIRTAEGADDSLTQFYLARFAREWGTPYHLQFSADTMFEWSANEHAMNLACTLHGFTHPEYRNFIAHNPLAIWENAGLSRKMKILAAKFLPHRVHHMLRRLLKKGP